MATVSDITTIPFSGLLHIDALLDTGPDWNYLNSNNTIYYTFSVASGNEDPQWAQKNFTGTQQAFSLAQQTAVRALLDGNGYISSLTGIHFVETTNGANAQIHLANVNLIGSTVTGLCSWESSYSYAGTELVSYNANAYVYLDNTEWYAQNRNLVPGTDGYETLLHEMGHALGLKHSFNDPTPDNPNPIYLPRELDNTGNTLMSYTHATGQIYSQYSPYDVAALNWLYGGDGLGGALGINSTGGGRYITGTSGADTLTGTAANDKLQGNGGNDMIDGGDGIDTAVFRGARNDYMFAALANGDLLVTSKDTSPTADGVDTLHSIEFLQFADMTASRADVLADTVPPVVPTLVVTKNANGYATGNTPLVTGKTEAGAIVKIYNDSNQQVGTATADANGIWTTKLSVFPDGQGYHVYATATDAAGNVSGHSEVVAFNVDATPPPSPTYSMSFVPGANQATFTGTAEANTTIELLRTDGDLQTIARTSVGTDGKWTLQTSPLPNGNYTVSVISLDKVNGTTAQTHATFTVNSPDNITGTSGNDVLKPGVGNNGVDGGAGLDTAVYTGSKSNFTVMQEAWGFGVTDNVGNNGHDALINVERVQFDDGWLALDVDGSAGQIFRLYSAAFGRPAESAGMGYWLWRMDAGTSLQTVSKEFMTGQPEFDKMYGINPTNEVFVTQLYRNVLHRDPDAAGLQYWTDTINTNSNPDKVAVRAQMLIDFSDSLENQALVVGSVQHGLDYTPWHG